MVWLHATTRQGQGLYLDIWRREKPRDRANLELISATLGDGSYEGEVLVELSQARCELTFIDQLFDPRALAAFMARIDREELLEALRIALHDEDRFPGQPHARVRHDPPAGYGDLPYREPRVCEPAAQWRADSPRVRGVDG